MNKDKNCFYFEDFEAKDFLQDKEDSRKENNGRKIEEQYDEYKEKHDDERKEKHHDDWELCYHENEEEHWNGWKCCNDEEKEKHHDECKEKHHDECKEKHHDECKEKHHDEYEEKYYDEYKEKHHDECKEKHHDECKEKHHDECKEKHYDECKEKHHDECEEKHHDECKEKHHDDWGNDEWKCDKKDECCHKFAKLVLHKHVDKCVAMKGEVLRYSITIKNVGNTDACNVVLKDHLSKELRFVPGSLEIEGRCIESCRELEELLIGTICPGREIKICFSVKIVEDCDDVKNCAVACFWFIPHRCSKPVKEQEKSNEVVTKILRPEVVIEKHVDKECAKVGDELEYKIIVKNCGNVKAEDFVLKDELDCNLKCLKVSVKGDCCKNKEICCEDLEKGLKLGDIKPHEVCEVCIKARIQCPPVGCFIKNRARGEFKVNCIKLHAESNEVKTRVILHICKKECLEDVIKVPCCKGPVKNICKKFAEAKLVEVKEIKECDDDRKEKDFRIYKIKIATKVCFEYHKECEKCDSICKECIWEKNICVPRCYEYGKNFTIDVCAKELEAKVKCEFDILYKLDIEVCLKND